MSTTIGGVRIVDMPDLGVVTDASSLVGELAGSGRFGAQAIASYVSSKVVIDGRVSVKTYGAKGDRVTDDTAAINAAIAATPANGTLYFPTGNYLASTAFEITKTLTISGDGRLASTITTASPTADIFTITAGVDIYDMGFDASVTRTAGAFVNWSTGAGRCRIDRFWMTHSFYGIRIASASSGDFFISDGEILEWVTGGGGIRIDGGDAIQINSCLLDQGAAPGVGYGIYITNTGDVAIVASDIMAAGFGLFVNPTSGQSTPSVWADTTYFDNCQTGVRLQADGGTISRAKFTGCWMSSATTSGVILATSAGGEVGGVDFIGCHVFGNTNDGISIADSGVWDVQVNGCAIAGNGGAGVDVNTTHPWRVENCRIGAAYGWGGNTSGGILIDAGCTGFAIIGNDLTGNQVSALSGAGLYAAGSIAIIKDNLGWVTSASGTSNIGTGLAAVTVTHGLNSNGVAPGTDKISLSLLTGLGTAGNTLYLASTTATTFTVQMTAVQGAAVGFSWQARMPGAG
jgi:hypothetical protein